MYIGVRLLALYKLGSETVMPALIAQSISDAAYVSFACAFFRERVTLGGSVLILRAIR